MILVGRAEALAEAASWPRCTVIAATEVVEMDDPIEVALRRKRDSSLRVALNQVKPGADGQSAAQACVSAGNTGALMAVSRYVLKTLEGIDRPAIAAVMPNQLGRYTTVLDLGANVDCTADHLLQFAVMGSALVAAVDGKENPSVGLLNIGEEEIKGSEVIKQAGELLRRASDAGHLNFYGNVALKTAEGAAAMFVSVMKEEFTRSPLTKLAAMMAMPVLKHFRARLDHRRYSGGALLGLRGLVFKAHGSSDAFAFEQALNRAYDAASNGLLERVHDRILETLAATPASAGDTNAPGATLTA